MPHRAAAAGADNADPLPVGDPSVAVQELDTSAAGLSSAEAERRLRQYGPNRIRERGQLTRWRVLFNQVRNPLLPVLLFASAASAVTGEWIDAGIVLVIVVTTVGIGYAREYSAHTG
jgi:magnesium-transporting ATPase (P-type)